MERQELIESPEYWVSQMQITLWEAARLFGTQKKLAEKVGMSNSHLSEILSGNKKCSINTYCKLMLACGKVPKIIVEELKDQS